VIHYHGGRHSTWQVAVEIWGRRHALVSYADPQQNAIAAEVAQSFALDNGAFSVWKQGIAVDWKGYYSWVEEWWRHPGFDWAVIPDVIDGDETANDELVAEWPLGKHVAHHRAADRALADAAPLSNQLGEAILLHAQSKSRGDMALEG